MRSEALNGITVAWATVTGGPGGTYGLLATRGDVLDPDAFCACGKLGGEVGEG